MQRPDRFILDASHRLANGLIFAGLGQLPGTSRYADSSVYGRHGTLVNMEPDLDWHYSPEIERVCTLHDGVNENVTAPVTTPTGVLSVAVWVYSTSNATQEIVTNAGSTITLRRRPGGGTDDYVYLWSPGGGYKIHFTSSVAANTWYHLGAIYDGSTVTIYSNGVPGASPVASTDTVHPSSTLYVGRHDIGATTNPFAGRLADVMLWNRAIAPGDMKELAIRSNTMLSGLLRPPARKWFPVGGGFKAAWVSSRRRQFIGGGF